MDNLTFYQITQWLTTIDWSAWITAIATIVLAVLTAVYVRITGNILAAQSDPCVILSVVQDEERPTILQLIVRNVGTGIAHEISFKFSRPIPKRAFGFSIDDKKLTSDMKDGPLIDGIPALGPGEYRKIDWGQYGGLISALGKEPVIAFCSFKKNGRKMSPTKCPLDVNSFTGTVATERPATKSAKELEKISKSIQHLVSRYPMKIEVVPLQQNQLDEDFE